MKKFVFTNEKYYNIKSKDYDALKRRMESVDKDIEAVCAMISAAELKFESERDSYNTACKKGVRAETLRTYQWFFPYLREQQEALNIELERLSEEKRRLREQLIKIHNEIRVLDEMREEQYAVYLKEVAAEEAKELDSFMSFTIYEGAV